MLARWRQPWRLGRAHGGDFAEGPDQPSPWTVVPMAAAAPGHRIVVTLSPSQDTATRAGAMIPQDMSPGLFANDVNQETEPDAAIPPKNGRT